MVNRTKRNKKKGDSFIETLSKAFNPAASSRQTLKEQAATRSREEIDRNNEVMQQGEIERKNREEQETKLKPERFVIDQDTGKVSGVRDETTGNITFLPPEDILAIQRKDNKINQATQQAIQENELIRAENNQILQQQAIQNIGQEVDPTVEVGQGQPGLARAGAFGAFSGAGGAAVLGSAVSSAATGATFGSAIPVVGTAIGAVVGASLAVFGAVINEKIKTKKEAVGLYKDQTSRQFTAIMNMANQGMEPSAIIREYNTMLANIRESERALSAIARTSTGRDLTGAQKELNQVRLWLQDETIYRSMVIQAVQKPNPNLVYNLPEIKEENE